MSDSIGDLIKIGKPSAFHNDIDKDHRVGKFLRSRMNIIDLLPCTYKMNFAAGTDTVTESSGLVPEINYDTIDEYKKTCGAYGLNPVSGIRLYTTDSTTPTDSISNNLKDNYFQSGLNKASEIMSPIKSMMASTDKDMTSDLMDSLKESMKLDNRSENDSYGNLANKLLSTATDVIGKGYRISLPSIWSNSSYEPHFQANIKLVSPYGHPKAIKEFIIRPLMHLLILSSPKTEDGVSYGNPYCLTIKAYGMNYTPIGMISNITLRRGGNDTSYNLFKQPLSVEVSLDFQYLVKGFAHYTNKKLAGLESDNLFGSSDGFEYLNTMGGDTALPTVGHIVRSLKPREPDIPYENCYNSNLVAARNTKETSSEDSFLSSLTAITPPSLPGLSDMGVTDSQLLSDKSTLNNIGFQIADVIINEAIDTALS